MSEAARKRESALDAAGSFTTDDPADVRWLLCGRGRPVATDSSPYLVSVAHDRAQVFFQDIEASRVATEERWEELGYEPVPYPWYEQPPVAPTRPDLAVLRHALSSEELKRYRVAGRDAAAAFVDALESFRPSSTEYDATAQIAGRLQERGFTTPVLLAGGDARAVFHRHPLPTRARLGAFALLAFTAEREGLYVSMTRVVAFRRPPALLEERVRAAAEVDAAVLEASRPGRTLGELFDVLADAYAAQGFPEEWRKHHQGGLTGYRGREVFATPGDETVLPDGCAVAWNPSITGGGKSEDTAIVTDDGVEIVTATPELPLLDVARPAVVQL